MDKVTELAMISTSSECVVSDKLREDTRVAGVTYGGGKHRLENHFSGSSDG
jgi:hypothetical protein